MPRGTTLASEPFSGGFVELTSLGGSADGSTPALITATGVTNTADVRGMLQAALEVNNTDDAGLIMTVEGALRESGVWAPIAWRLSAVTTDPYTKTAVTVPATSTALLFLADTDKVNFIRCNVTQITAPGASIVVGASR